MSSLKLQLQTPQSSSFPLNRMLFTRVGTLFHMMCGGGATTVSAEAVAEE